MLTQDQKDKLEPLTKHEKFGKILTEAMKSWEITKPARRIFGIESVENIWKAERFSNECCCLVGAALLNKSTNIDSDSYCESFENIYSLTSHEIDNLISGFDQNYSFFATSKEYDFGKEVSEIIFGKLI